MIDKHGNEMPLSLYNAKERLRNISRCMDDIIYYSELGLGKIKMKSRLEEIAKLFSRSETQVEGFYVDKITERNFK